jgi:type VI protein secretion system component Hcp
MALEIFCKIEKIPCESNVGAYKDSFKVESFQIGGMYNYNIATETGQGTTDLGAVQISKLIDKSSANIMDAVLYKLKVPKVTIEIVNDKSKDGGRAKHVTYTLEQCRITSYMHQTSGSLSETISILYRILKFDDHFTSQKMQYNLGEPDAKKSL